jgi:hypothetical protein
MFRRNEVEEDVAYRGCTKWVGGGCRSMQSEGTKTEYVFYSVGGVKMIDSWMFNFSL